MSFGLKSVDQSLFPELGSSLTLEELYQAASVMNLAKAPGVDGITLEFYLKFWTVLGPLVLMWFRQTLAIGCLTGTAALGVVTLINKSGDPRMLYNWRPITLMSVDVKIVCKALAGKLLPAVASVLPCYQTAIPGKSIHTSLAIIRDIISLCKLSNSPLYLLALDQAKAFDRVNHKFLFHLLETINLPPLVVDSVKALYSGFSCVIKNVSQLSRVFPYKRGIRQGDPMSTALYTLAIQPALNAIHIALHDEGFLLPDGDRILLSAYADDVTLFLRSSDAIPAVLAAFEEVGRYSEAALNLFKSSVMAFNKVELELAPGQVAVHGVPRLSTSIKILGVHFVPSMKIHTPQWDQTIQSTRDAVARSVYFLKNLTYVQRSMWISRKLWPRWSFLLKTLQPTGAQIKQLAVVLVEAIWLGGRHWLSVDDLAAGRLKGGLEVVCPQDKIDSIRICMLGRMLTDLPSSHSFQLAEMILNSYANFKVGFRLLHTVPDPVLLRSFPPVYMAALLAWERIPTSFFPQSLESLMSLPVFNSKFLRQQDPPVLVSCSQAISMNISTLEDLCSFMPSSTRLSQSLVYNTSKAVGSWCFVPAPDVPKSSSWGGGCRLGALQQDRRPSFFLVLEEKCVIIDNWSNNLISKFLRSGRQISRSLDVPANTWKILFAISAPSTFINQTWRFFHKCVPTASFYAHLGLSDSASCILCGDLDNTMDHQFRLCPVVVSAFRTLSDDIVKLELPFLADFFQLYPFPNNAHRLANFLVVAFIYAVIAMTRYVANSSSRISADRFNDIYYAVVSKHIVFHARVNPPSFMDIRFRWDIYTWMGLVAYFKEDKLWVRTSNGYKMYDEDRRELA